MNSSKNKINLVPAVDKAIRILFLLSERKSLNITDISSLLDINKSTVFSIVNSLVYYDLLEKDVKSNEYSIGYKINELAASNNKRHDYLDIFNIVGEGLSNRCLELVNYSILVKSNIQIVSQISPDISGLKVGLPNGTLIPAYCSKAVLVDKTFDELHSLYPENLHTFTPFTTKSLDSLYNKLQVIKKYGYSINIDEYQMGLSSISAPTYKMGIVHGSINVLLPTIRLNEKKEMICSLITQSASEMSQKLNVI